MLNRLVLLVALANLVSAAPALAQEPRAEVSMLFGWAFSEGVDGDPVATADGIFDRVDPKSSFKWGLSAGALLADGAEVGFLFGQQRTTLKASGTNTVDIGDMTVNTYHGYFAYNFLDADDPVRPYVLGGLGATNFSSVDFTRLNVKPARLAASRGFPRCGARA